VVQAPSGLPDFGDVIGNRYRVTGEVGHGSMSVVFRADDLEGGEPIAVRFLRPERANARAQERFRRESAFAIRVAHPNIPPVYDVGRWNDLAYMVMRLINGRDLKQLLDEHGPLDPQMVVTTMIQVAEALEEAHAAGIIHRDLKSPNILREGNHAWVIDFGIARSLQEPRLTATGIAVGTPAYMAPEVARGITSINGQADLYSLGVTMYEILSGELPFYDDDPLRLLEMHVREPVPSLKMARPSLPDELVEVVETCLEKRRDDRYADATEFGVALDRALRAILSTPPRMPQPFTRPPGYVVVSLDDRRQEDMVRDAAKRVGAKVRIARNGKEAVRMLSNDEARFGLVSQERLIGVGSAMQSAPLYVVGGAQGSLDGHRHLASNLSLGEIESLVNRFIRARHSNAGSGEG